jgi:hypothetical protein
MPLFRPEQDKNLRLPRSRKAVLTGDPTRFTRRVKILSVLKSTRFFSSVIGGEKRISGQK